MTARIDTAAERARLDVLLRNARRDECLDRMVTIDLRQIIGRSIRMLDEIDRLTAALAEAEDRAHYANGVAELAMKHRDIAECALTHAEDRGAARMRERAAEEAISSAHGGHYVACAIRALTLREPGAT